MERYVPNTCLLGRYLGKECETCTRRFYQNDGAVVNLWFCNALRAPPIQSACPSFTPEEDLKERIKEMLTERCTKVVLRGNLPFTQRELVFESPEGVSILMLEKKK